MWAVVGLLPRREALALQCLDFRGFTTYLPRIRQRRIVRGRRVETTPPLFPGYAFISIENQWHAARWSPGVLSLIMDGAAPARVPDNIIADIRAREHNVRAAAWTAATKSGRSSINSSARTAEDIERGAADDKTEVLEQATDMVLKIALIAPLVALVHPIHRIVFTQKPRRARAA